MSKGTFLYFAYGSNLLGKRIHLNNPTAKRVCCAKLPEYRLDFNFWSQCWKGYAATIVEDKNSTVWGAVWELEESDKDHLDQQEGVSLNVYKPLEVLVHSRDHKEMICRTYQLVKPPTTPPEERLPSEAYVRVIIEGAEESGLPASYVEFLKSIPHNGFSGPVNLKLSN